MAKGKLGQKIKKAAMGAVVGGTTGYLLGKTGDKNSPKGAITTPSNNNGTYTLNSGPTQPARNPVKGRVIGTVTGAITGALAAQAKYKPISKKKKTK